MSIELQSKRFETNSHETYPRGGLTAKETRAMALFWAHLRYALWQIISKAGMGVVYVGIVSEGARRLFPSFGQKLFKLVPLLDQLDHRIDVAHCFALAILLGTWWSWTQLLEMWIGVKPYTRATTITVPLAFTFIVVDTVLFYTATAQWRWGGSLMSFTSILATAGYVAVLVFVTFVGIQLKEEIRKAKS